MPYGSVGPTPIDPDDAVWFVAEDHETGPVAQAVHT